jgi:hypothetical protein
MGEDRIEFAPKIAFLKYALKAFTWMAFASRCLLPYPPPWTLMDLMSTPMSGRDLTSTTMSGRADCGAV